MSSIIKKGSLHADSSGLTVAPLAFNLDDMSVRATERLEQVRSQAAQILREAQQQANAIRKQAETEGIRTAQQHAEKMLDEKLAQQMKTVLPALQKMVQELDQARQAWLQHWQSSAVKLSTRMAERIIRREIAAQPEITLDLVREALDLAGGTAEINIQMHPLDVQNLGTQVERIVAGMRSMGTARIIANEAITRGGCRLDTRFGTIDQQIEAQLQRIEEELN